MRVVKYIGIASAGLAGLVVLLFAVVALFFDPNDYKDVLNRWAEAQIGRSLTIGDDLQLDYFPWLAVQTGDIEIGNAEGFGPAPFARIEELSARVRLLPLFTGRVDIGTVIVSGLELDLARTAAGQSNWADLLADAQEAAPSAAAAPSGTDADANLFGIEAIVLRDARVVWREDDNPRYVISALQLDTGTIQLDAPMDLEFSLSLLDVQSQDTTQLVVDTSIALTSNGGLAAETAALNYGVFDGSNRERLIGTLALDDVLFNPDGNLLSSTRALLEARLTDARLPAGEVRLEVNWDAVQYGMDANSLDISGLVTRVGNVSATWQIVASGLGSDGTALSGSVIVADSEAADLLALLGDVVPESLENTDFGRFTASTRFNVDLGAGRIELLDTNATVLGANLQMSRAVADADSLSADFDIAPFRPDATLRELLTANLPADSLDAGALERLALSGRFESNAGGASLRDIEAELFGGQLTGSFELLGSTADGVIVGELATTPLSPGELLAALAPLTGPGVSAPQLGPVRIDTDLRYSLRSSALALNPVTVEAFGLAASGEVAFPAVGQANEVTGRLRSTAPFIARDLLSRLNITPPQTSDPAALGTTSVAVTFDVGPNRAAFTGIDLQLDDSRITGNLTVEDYADPRLAFQLNADRLNADRYLPPQGEAAAAGERRAGDMQLSADALSAYSIDGSVRVGELRLAGLEFQNVGTAILVGGGRMQLDDASANLYDGTFAGRFHINASAGARGMLLAGNVRSVTLEPLLQALTGSNNFTGTADFDIDLSGTGDTITQNLEAAAGTFGFALTSGSIRGFNIDKTLCRAFNRLNDQPAPPASLPDATRYSVIRGTAAVADGIARSSDLFARAGSVEVRGTGNLALAEQLTDYRFEARLAETVPIPGCEAMERIVGEDFPLVMRGPMTTPEIEPDYSEVIRRVVEDRLRDAVEERVQERLLDLLR